MSCERCNDLCVRFDIRSPYQLKQAIKIVNENIVDGTIFEISLGGRLGFSKLAVDCRWSDVIACRFKCSSCGEEFSLHVETYHGSGGCWEPVNPEADCPHR